MAPMPLLLPYSPHVEHLSSPLKRNVFCPTTTSRSHRVLDGLALASHVHIPATSWPSAADAADLDNPHQNKDAFEANAAILTKPSFVSLTPPSPPLDPPSPTVCVVGCGFVGLSLLNAFSAAYPRIGFDISAERVAHLRSTLANLEAGNASLSLTTAPEDIRAATHFLISVPTLLNADDTCDMTHVSRAVATVLAHARPGSTIVIESSVTVGATRALLGPHAHRFHCGTSPERIDPGRTDPPAHAVPKLVAGLTPAARDAIVTLYSAAFDTVVPVSKPEVAEMAKLHENCFRLVNIAYAAEVADACRAAEICPHEVVAAAATKPFGFMPFTGGLGAGGHCIPVNPHFLMQGRRRAAFPVLDRATRTLARRPARLARAFHRCVVLRRGARPRVLVVGFGFKRGEGVVSFSPGVALARELSRLGCADLAFYDPLVEQAQVPWLRKLGDGDWNAKHVQQAFDGLALCVDQKGVDWAVAEHVGGVSGGVFVRKFF